MDYTILNWCEANSLTKNVILGEICQELNKNGFTRFDKYKIYKDFDYTTSEFIWTAEFDKYAINGRISEKISSQHVDMLIKLIVTHNTVK